jgi:putative transcriptional regulator
MARKTSRPRTPTLADEITEGLTNAIRYAKGDKSAGIEHRVEVPDRVDVKRVRAKLGMSQTTFSKRFGISMATLRNWGTGATRS